MGGGNGQKKDVNAKHLIFKNMPKYETNQLKSKSTIFFRKINRFCRLMHFILIFLCMPSSVDSVQDCWFCIGYRLFCIGVKFLPSPSPKVMTILVITSNFIFK